MNMTEFAETGGRLIEALTQQRSLYEQLRDLTQRQTEMIDGLDPQMLLKVLAERQRLIDRLAVISRELAPIRARWNEVFEGLSPAQRAEVQRLVDQTQHCLGEIMSRDRDDAARLGQSRDEVAREIRGVQAGRRVNNAYARQAVPAPRGSFDVMGQ